MEPWRKRKVKTETREREREQEREKGKADETEQGRNGQRDSKEGQPPDLALAVGRDPEKKQTAPAVQPRCPSERRRCHPPTPTDPGTRPPTLCLPPPGSERTPPKQPQDPCYVALVSSPQLGWPRVSPHSLPGTSDPPALSLCPRSRLLPKEEDRPGGTPAHGKACSLPGSSPQQTNTEGTGKKWGRGSQEDPQTSFP